MKRSILTLVLISCASILFAEFSDDLLKYIDTTKVYDITWMNWKEEKAEIANDIPQIFFGAYKAFGGDRKGDLQLRRDGTGELIVSMGAFPIECENDEAGVRRLFTWGVLLNEDGTLHIEKDYYGNDALTCILVFSDNRAAAWYMTIIDKEPALGLFTK